MKYLHTPLSHSHVGRVRTIVVEVVAHGTPQPQEGHNWAERHESERQTVGRRDMWSWVLADVDVKAVLLVRGLGKWRTGWRVRRRC